MSDLICTNVESLNIQVQVIDQAIIDLKSVVGNLSGEKGVKLIAEAGRLVDENLSGEFEQAITHVSREREICYKDAIFNIEVMVLVLKVYREYLRNGPSGKLVENKQHIEMAPKDMDKQILDLEFSISDIKPKLFNTSYVDGYVRSRRSYLESEIRRKESHQPEPLDASRERYLLSVLNHNEKEHGVAIDNIENGISAITVLNSEIEEEIGVLKKEFDDYYKLWDVYENKDVKIVTYNNINYSLADIDGILGDMYEENSSKLKENISNFFNDLGEDIKDFFYDVAKAGFFNNLDGLSSYLPDFNQIDWEHILKGVGPFGLVDIGFMFHHISGIINGDDKYESWKHLAGDIGSWGVGYFSTLVGTRLGVELGVVVGTAVEPGGGTTVGGVIGGFTGGFFAGAAGSVFGERWLENSFESIVPEDEDHTIHWFWEEDWMPWNK